MKVSCSLVEMCQAQTTQLKKKLFLHMSHFAYACKMRYPLNLVLESWEYLWFY